jgi:hypothetical protein
MANNSIAQITEAHGLLARYLAKRDVKDWYRARGYRVTEIDPVELAGAINRYLEENRARLREEARTILAKIG